MEIRNCPRCTGNASRGWVEPRSLGPQLPATKHSRVSDGGGGIAGGAPRQPRPCGPLPAPPPACAPSRHLLPRPPGRSRRPPPRPHGNARPDRPPWPPRSRAAHLAPIPPQLGRPRPRRPGGPHSSAEAGDQSWSARRQAATRASTWAGCWAYPDGSEATQPLGISHSRETLPSSPAPSVHPVRREEPAQH